MDKKQEKTNNVMRKSPPAKEQKEKEPAFQLEGVVGESIKGGFRVKIPSQKPDIEDMFVLCRLAGKLRRNDIKIVPGDRVKIEVSPYDLTKGRIVFRLK